MVSAVFHSPMDAAIEVRKERESAATPAAARPQPAAAKAARMPFDWRELWLRVLPPVIGFALLVGVWALLTQGSKSFPTPAATFEVHQLLALASGSRRSMPR